MWQSRRVTILIKPPEKRLLDASRNWVYPGICLRVPWHRATNKYAARKSILRYIQLRKSRRKLKVFFNSIGLHDQTKHETNKYVINFTYFIRFLDAYSYIIIANSITNNNWTIFVQINCCKIVIRNLYTKNLSYTDCNKKRNYY